MVEAKAGQRVSQASVSEKADRALRLWSNSLTAPEEVCRTTIEEVKRGGSSPVIELNIRQAGAVHTAPPNSFHTLLYPLRPDRKSVNPELAVAAENVNKNKTTR